MALRSYYVFDLPASLVDKLNPFRGYTSIPPPNHIDDESLNTCHSIQSTCTQSASTPSDPTTCSYCGPIRQTENTREHYKTDFHRYNVKRKLSNRPVVTEEEFEALVSDTHDTQSISSISGSDSSEDDDQDDNDIQGTNHSLREIRLAKLMAEASVVDHVVYENGSQEQKKLIDGEDEVSHLKGSPYVLFVCETEFPNKCLAIYKSLLDPTLIQTDPVQALRLLPSTGHSVVLMIGGGHFSGAVISHVASKQRNTAQNPYASIQIVAHKTFHRYTTRRKQGGAQSASDNAHGKANSAGSSLRRANEAALQLEIRELLQSWRHHILGCSAIYIRASGRSNRNILLNYDKAPIVSSDPRIRTLPFTTKRATATEIKRAWHELTTTKLIEKPEIGFPNQKQTVSHPDLSSSPSQLPSPAKKLLTIQEKQSEEIVSLIKRSRSPRLIAYMRSNGLDPNFKLEPSSQFQTTPNPLFYAASSGSHHIIGTLLTTLKADPTIKNNTGKTAFQLASNQSTKDAFQLARFTLGEQIWDWKLARVGPPITTKQVNERESKEKELLAAQRQQELDQLQIEQSQKHKKSNSSLNNSQSSNLSNSIVTSIGQQAALRDLSDEAKKKLEREMRARAAEARLKRFAN